MVSLHHRLRDRSELWVALHTMRPTFIKLADNTGLEVTVTYNGYNFLPNKPPLPRCRKLGVARPVSRIWRWVVSPSIVWCIPIGLSQRGDSTMQCVRIVPKFGMEFMWQHGMPPLRQPTYGNHQGVGYVHTRNRYRTPQTTVWANALNTRGPSV